MTSLLLLLGTIISLTAATVDDDHITTSQQTSPEEYEKFQKAYIDYIGAPSTPIPEFTLGSRHLFQPDFLKARVTETNAIATKLAGAISQPSQATIPALYEWHGDRIVRVMNLSLNYENAFRRCQSDGAYLFGPEHLVDFVDLGYPFNDEAGMWVELTPRRSISTADDQRGVFYRFSDGTRVPDEFRNDDDREFTTYKGTNQACIAITYVSMDIEDQPCSSLLSAACVLPPTRTLEIRWAKFHFDILERFYRPQMLNLIAKISSFHTLFETIAPDLPEMSCPYETEEALFTASLLKPELLDDTLNSTAWIVLHAQLKHLHDDLQQLLWRQQILGLVRSEGHVCDAVVRNRLGRPHHQLHDIVRTLNTIANGSNRSLFGNSSDPTDYFTYEDPMNDEPAPNDFLSFTLADIVLAFSTLTVAILSLFNRLFPPIPQEHAYSPVNQRRSHRDASVRSVRFHDPQNNFPGIPASPRASITSSSSSSNPAA